VGDAEKDGCQLGPRNIMDNNVKDANKCYCLCGCGKMIRMLRREQIEGKSNQIGSRI